MYCKEFKIATCNYEVKLSNSTSNSENISVKNVWWNLLIEQKKHKLCCAKYFLVYSLWLRNIQGRNRFMGGLPVLPVHMYEFFCKNGLFTVFSRLWKILVLSRSFHGLFTVVEKILVISRSFHGLFTVFSQFQNHEKTVKRPDFFSEPWKDCEKTRIFPQPWKDRETTIFTKFQLITSLFLTVKMSSKSSLT